MWRIFLLESEQIHKKEIVRFVFDNESKVFLIETEVASDKKKITALDASSSTEPADYTILVSPKFDLMPDWIASSEQTTEDYVIKDLNQNILSKNANFKLGYKASNKGFIHISELILYWTINQMQGAEFEQFLCIHGNLAYIYTFLHGKLQLANAYAVKNIEEILYFSTAALQEIGAKPMHTIVQFLLFQQKQEENVTHVFKSFWPNLKFSRVEGLKHEFEPELLLLQYLQLCG